MINRILSLFASFKLTLTEWLAGGGALVVGGLVVALKIQGSRLHKAQLGLLDQHVQAKDAKAADDTEAARTKYQSVLQEFLKAGGTLLIVACLLGLAPRAGGESNLLPKCEKALSACADLVKAQDNQISVLKDSEKQWKKKAEEEVPGLFQSIPWPVWVVLGGVMGYGAGRLHK